MKDLVLMMAQALVDKPEEVEINEVNKLLKQFVQMQKMMKKLSSGKGRGFDFGGMMGGRGLSPF